MTSGKFSCIKTPFQFREVDFNIFYMGRYQHRRNMELINTLIPRSCSQIGG